MEYKVMTRRSIRAVLLASALATLPACKNEAFDFSDNYRPSSHYERYPIMVATAPIRMEVKPSRNGLTQQDIDAVGNVAHSAQLAGVNGITVQRPSGGGASATAAAQIYKILTSNGIRREMINMSTYRAGSSAPVRLAFVRPVAITKECGDWSSNLADTYSNKPYANFGCSIQHNIAAMVQKPDELIAPSPVYPVPAESRTRAITASYGSANGLSTSQP